MLTRSFNDYLTEAAFAADQPVAGDVLYIELSETEIFECTVVENKSGTIIVEDSRLYETLDLTEELDDEEPDEEESEEDDEKEHEEPDEYLKWIHYGDQIDEDLNAIRRLSGYTNVSEVSDEAKRKWLDAAVDDSTDRFRRQGKYGKGGKTTSPEKFNTRRDTIQKVSKEIEGKPRFLDIQMEELTSEAEYQGRKVELNKPMQGDVAKSKVYVKDPSTGNVKKVNFGDKNMRIKKSIPARRRSFRARHNCDNPGPKTSARYWSCRAW